MNKIFLRINMIDLYKKNIEESPFEILEKLGIKYEYYIPQIISDSIDFWCISNVKETKYKKLELKFENKNPIYFIGYGLNEEKANKIKNWIKENV